MNEYNGLPHPEIRQLVSDIEDREVGPQIDKRIMEALNRHDPFVICPTISLSDALSLVPEKWWWYISHLEACITPTVNAPGFEGLMSNAGAYDKRGKVISYRSSHYDRSALPSAICAAMLKAVYNLPTAYGVQAYATDKDEEFQL